MLPVIDLKLAPRSESASVARHSVDDLLLLEEHLSSEQLEDIRLLVSELVTNAVRHAGLAPQERIRFKVYLCTRFVRVEVHDSGPGFEQSRFERFRLEAPPLEKVGGRGLYLVTVLADRWGTESSDLFCAWFEIDR